MTPSTTNGAHRNRALNRFVRYCAFAVAILLLGRCAWFGFNSFPAVNIYGGAVSPDGQWVVLTEYIQQGPLAVGNLDTAVELRRFDEPFEFLTGQRVFIVGYEQNNAILGAKWLGENSIIVTTRPFDQNRLGLKLNEYKGIKIVYEVRSDP